MSESSDSVLCLEVSHKVTHESYNNLYLPALRKIFEKYGEVRILYFYPDPERFPGWEESAAKQDLENVIEYGKHVGKIALVDAPDMVKKRWDLISPLLRGEVRNFSGKDLEKAVAWIQPNKE